MTKTKWEKLNHYALQFLLIQIPALIYFAAVKSMLLGRWSLGFVMILGNFVISHFCLKLMKQSIELEYLEQSIEEMNTPKRVLQRLITKELLAKAKEKI